MTQLPLSRHFMNRKPLSEAINTWKMAKNRICMNLFNISDIWYLTPSGGNHTKLPSERHSNNGKCIIKLINSPNCHFQELSFSENRFPMPSILEKWQRAVFAWIYLTFQTLDIFDNVKYQIPEMLNKFMQKQLFAIFQVLMASESGFRKKKGLENGSLEN